MALYQSRGTIASLSEIKSGTSDSGFHWRHMDMVLEITGYQGMTTKQVFRVSNDEVEAVMAFKVGDKVDVSWSMYAREWNGRMFNNVDLVRISPAEAKTAPAQKSVPQFTPEDLAPQEDDLPFK